MNNNEKMVAVDENQQIAPVILLTDGKRSTGSSQSGGGAKNVSPEGGSGNDKKPTSGFAIASFVLGILSILLVFVCLFDSFILPLIGGIGIALSIIGIALAAVAKKKGDVSGLATAGIVMNIVPLAIMVLLICTCTACVGCIGAILANA